MTDPTFEIRMQVMWNRLISVVEEQAMTLLRTAFSTSVREAGDLSAGVFDPQGRMLAQAVTGTPGHVNAMADAVARILDDPQRLARMGLEARHHVGTHFSLTAEAAALNAVYRQLGIEGA